MIGKSGAKLPKPKVVVIGAGPSGIATAVELTKQNFDVTILEKTDRIGGKCFTYKEKRKIRTLKKDPRTGQASPVEEIVELKTELGAALVAVTPDYKFVQDMMKVTRMDYEIPVSTSQQNLPFFSKMNELHEIEKAAYIAEFVKEIVEFNTWVDIFKKNPTSATFAQTFAKFAEEHHLKTVSDFLEPFVAGFGYGVMTDIATPKVLDYMKKATVPALIFAQLLNKPTIALRAIKGGYQTLMENIVKHFNINVVTNANVVSIVRGLNGVKVQYTENDKPSLAIANALVLSISPQHYKDLNMNLSPEEEKCHAKVTFHPYPVAACKLKGQQKPECIFLKEAFDEKGYTEPSLMTTSDARINPEDGRLCTIYANFPSESAETKNHAADKLNEAFFTDLAKKASAGIQQTLTQEVGHETKIDIEIVKSYVWTDYNPTINEALMEATKKEEQLKFDVFRTLHVGAAFSFEDVGCVMNHASERTKEFLVKKLLGLPLGAAEQKTFKQEATEFATFQESKIVEPVGAAASASACGPIRCAII